MILGLLLTIAAGKALAIVGQAEEYDPFKLEDLEDFHQNLTNEELKEQLDSAEQLSKMLKTKQKEAGKKEDAVEKDTLNQEIERLKVQLLKLPKRDRFQIETTGSYNFTTNAKRAILNEEKNDSKFNARNAVVFDLSGKKTDLKFAVEGSREWNWEFSENDTYELAESLSYRKKYFKRIAHSVKSRIGRTNSKTIEIDEDKIRWDFSENTAYNFLFSRKLSLNLSMDGTKRAFPQEAFDQDSAWEAKFAPSAFWNMTPKSRLSLGYDFGANRIRSKAGNSNAHGVRLGYFGQVTKKSSTSLDLTYQLQTPKSLETNTVKTITTGLGYIWQMTPKTQLTTQVIRSMQNTSSNLESGEVDGANTTAKPDIHYTNSSVSFSINSRLTRKLTGIIDFTASHLKTETDALAPTDDPETQQMNFPVSVKFSYYVTPHAVLNLGYSFSYRTGDERTDKSRAHILDVNMRLVI